MKNILAWINLHNAAENSYCLRHRGFDAILFLHVKEECDVGESTSVCRGRLSSRLYFGFATLAQDVVDRLNWFIPLHTLLYYIGTRPRLEKKKKKNAELTRHSWFLGKLRSIRIRLTALLYTYIYIYTYILTNFVVLRNEATTKWVTNHFARSSAVIGRLGISFGENM